MSVSVRTKDKKNKRKNLDMGAKSLTNLNNLQDDSLSVVDQQPGNTITVLCLSFSFIDLSNFRKDVEQAAICQMSTPSPPTTSKTSRVFFGNVQMENSPRINIKFNTVDNMVDHMHEVNFEFHCVVFLVNFLHPFLKAQLMKAIETFLDGGMFDLSIPMSLLSLHPEQDCNNFRKRIISDFGFEDDNLCYYKYDRETSTKTSPSLNSGGRKNSKQHHQVIQHMFDCLQSRVSQNMDMSNWHLLKYD
ncbi:uncharacterized protein LOC134842344 [Symsagittifera roscoffensis]|uniref:uncharacterized protein LOC134842344 n=1 Tax=Symsagittifera roscoffensis TaxID=84072 RepID=UPI00307B8AC2